MNERFFEPLLVEPIKNLELSRELLHACELNGFHTLADLLELHMTELLPLPGFDHRVWNEYVAYLEERYLGHYLN